MTGEVREVETGTSHMHTRGKRFSRGHMVLGLAAQLHDAGLDGGVAMNAAIDIMADLKTPPKWREALGDEVADAIDADIADPKTWTIR